MVIGKQSLRRNIVVMWMKHRARTRQAILVPVPPSHFTSWVTLLTQLTSSNLYLPTKHTSSSFSNPHVFCSVVTHTHHVPEKAALPKE